MNRITEPELMEEEEQVLAYAQADFEEPHNRVLELFLEVFRVEEINGHILDIGCGPGDISRRFARRFPHCQLTGVDGSKAMLQLARSLTEEALQQRLSFIHGVIPHISLPERDYTAIISTSFLHHLHDPQNLWDTISRYATKRSRIFLVDLLRPKDEVQADRLAATYSGAEPTILKKDFYNSLLAAFRPEEIKEQLRLADLSFLKVKTISDRHLMVWGTIQ